MTGILGQNFPYLGSFSAPIPRRTAPLYIPGYVNADVPGTADRMPNSALSNTDFPQMPPFLGGGSMATMMPSSPPLYQGDNRGATPQSNTGTSATPFDLESYLRRLGLVQ